MNDINRYDPRQLLSLNRYTPAREPGLEPGLRARIAARFAHAGAASLLVYDKPLELTRGEGVNLYDSAGRRYLDMFSDVPGVGHCHPEVVSAIAAQAATLAVDSRYLNLVTEDYAARLLTHFPAPLSNLLMTCTGSEANDVALRIARAVTGQRGVIVTEAAYHGNTEALAAISPAGVGGRGLGPHVRLIPAPDQAAAGAEPVGGWFARQMRAAIDDLQAHGFGLSAFFADCLFATDGVFPDPAGFLEEAVAVVRAAGGLLIADEMQGGFGRTGGGLWCFSRHHLVPDIVTLGKAMGNGFPVSGLVTSPDHLERFCASSGYFNSFGGNPVAAAAGMAVLDVLESEGLIRNAARVGDALKKGLKGLVRERPSIGAVRGAGLAIGVDLVDPETEQPDPAFTRRVVNALRQNFILLGTTGRYGHTLQIRPPLCFGLPQVEHFLEVFRAVLVGAAEG